MQKPKFWVDFGGLDDDGDGVLIAHIRDCQLCITDLEAELASLKIAGMKVTQDGALVYVQPTLSVSEEGWLTREEVERMRPRTVAKSILDAYNTRLYTLCDMALAALTRKDADGKVGVLLEKAQLETHQGYQMRILDTLDEALALLPRSGV